jgi:Fe-S-cluster containining protein
VFEVYEEIAGDFDIACVRGCSVCCTTRVMCTSAEAKLALVYAEEAGKLGMLTDATARRSPVTGQPALSMNELADYCLRKEEPPDAFEPPEISPCPLRDHDGCAIYEARPFACRSMWSRQVCEDGGQALMAPLQVTVAAAFQQIIEDIDCGGFYGNFLDVVSSLLVSEECRQHRVEGALLCAPALTPTRKNPGFIVPFEHRKRVSAYLALLWKQEIDGMPFKAAVDVLKG